MTAYNVSDSNLFAYCGNNPVMRGDDEGELWNIVAGAVVGGVVNSTISLITAAVSGDIANGKYDFWDWAGDLAIGAISGGLTASGIMSPVLVGAISGGLSSIQANYKDVRNGEMSLAEAGVQLCADVATGALVGYVGAGINTNIFKPGSTAQTIARTWQVNRGTILRNGFNAVGVEVMGNAVVAVGGYTARIAYRAVSSATKATVEERRLGAL